VIVVGFVSVLFRDLRGADDASKGVYCTQHPAVVCSILAAAGAAAGASVAASAAAAKPKRSRNSLDVGYDKKSLHQVHVPCSPKHASNTPLKNHDFNCFPVPFPFLPSHHPRFPLAAQVPTHRPRHTSSTR
jgi:hypothetical protein